MTNVLPLSALVTNNWFRFIFFFILFIRCRSCDSNFDWVVCHLSFDFDISFWMLFATICLIYFRSLLCNLLIAVSASIAKVLIQSLHS
jgi:hypothetical protein